jgi:hypothetical protein
VLDLCLGNPNDQASRPQREHGRCNSSKRSAKTHATIPWDDETDTSPQWLFNFVVVRAVPTMLVTVGARGYGTYLIFGSFAAAMFVFVWFCASSTAPLVPLHPFLRDPADNAILQQSSRKPRVSPSRVWTRCSALCRTITMHSSRAVLALRLICTRSRMILRARTTRLLPSHTLSRCESCVLKLQKA